jgi:hypothetical protein
MHVVQQEVKESVLMCVDRVNADVVNDEVLEKKCFELANELLANGGVDNIEKLSRDGEDPWTQEQIYLVQYAAVGVSI